MAHAKAVVGYKAGETIRLRSRPDGKSVAPSLLPATKVDPGERPRSHQMVKRIALKAIELTAAATLVSLIYFIAETPLRLAEYRMTSRE